MHLIMNALEEVTSRAHPNVSEISLLITLVSASAGFEPAAKKKKKKNGQTEESQFGPRSSSSHLLPFPAVFAAIQVLRLPCLKRHQTPFRSPLHSYCGNLNGE